MKSKYVAIGIAILVALVAIVGGVTSLSKSDDDSSNYHVPDVAGKWNLSYVEIANMSIIDHDSGSRTFISNADDVEIFERIINPYETTASLEITKVARHGFDGIFFHGVSHKIHGSLNGDTILFILKHGELVYQCEATSKGDYLTLSMVIRSVPEAGEDLTNICGVGYMMFLREGADPVPIRSDYFDMR